MFLPTPLIEIVSGTHNTKFARAHVSGSLLFILPTVPSEDARILKSDKKTIKNIGNHRTRSDDSAPRHPKRKEWFNKSFEATSKIIINAGDDGASGGPE